MSRLSEQRPMLWERCSGRCEVTGQQLDYETFDMHHRRNKGMGGTDRDNVDSPANLLALAPHIHNGGPHSVHGSRLWAELYGYLVPKHVADPGMWPVKLLGRRWVLLTESGGYAPVPPEVAKGLPR